MMIPNFTALIIGRVLIGVGFGVSNTLTPIFIKDINTREYQGPMISSVRQFINFGFVIAYLFALIFPSFYRASSLYPEYCEPLDGVHVPWRETHIIPYLIAFTQLGCLLFMFKREDPRYEEHYYKKTSSVNTQSSIITDDSDVKHMCFNIQEGGRTNLSQMERDSWTNLLKKSELKKVFSGSIIRFLEQFTGINLALLIAFWMRLHPDNRFLNLHLVIVLLSFFTSFGTMNLLK